jgi:hypothetical protein
LQGPVVTKAVTLRRRPGRSRQRGLGVIGQSVSLTRAVSLLTILNLLDRGSQSSIPARRDRAMLLRFTPGAMEANQVLVDLLKRIAEQKKATPAQIALMGPSATHPRPRARLSHFQNIWKADTNGPENHDPRCRAIFW